MKIENREKLYELLMDKKLYIKAYNKIKSIPGNMTPGTDNETLDGMSLNWIGKTIEEMKSEKFQFKPSRRIFIPKKNGKLRPIGIPNPRDKIIQEVMRMILEKIYEPLFLDYSHGFRPGRSCHTALREVKKHTGMTWVIEGDMKGFYDNIDHHILEKLLRQEIKDQRFIDLYWKAVKAGYVYENKYIPSELGIPQGGIISPILSNIYLHELDKYMDKMIKERSSSEKTTIENPEHNRITTQIRKMRDWLKREEGDNKEGLNYGEIKTKLVKLKKLQLSTPSVIYKEGITQISYIRYADDFIIGIKGTHSKTKEIKQEIKSFLYDKLKIELNEDKTKITNIKNEKVKFLGALIKTRKRTNKDLIATLANNTKRRTQNNILILEMATQDVIKKLTEKNILKKEDQRIIPQSNGLWVTEPVYQIVIKYNSIANGLINYYSFAYNIEDLKKILFFLKVSLVKTIAHKLRLNAKRVYKKFGKDITVYNEKLDKSISFTKFKTAQKNQWNFKPDKNNLDYTKVLNFNVVTNWSLESACIICDSMENV